MRRGDQLLSLIIGQFGIKFLFSILLMTCFFILSFEGEFTIFCRILVYVITLNIKYTISAVLFIGNL